MRNGTGAEADWGLVAIDCDLLDYLLLLARESIMLNACTDY